MWERRRVNKGGTRRCTLGLGRRRLGGTGGEVRGLGGEEVLAMILVQLGA